MDNNTCRIYPGFEPQQAVQVPLQSGKVSTDCHTYIIVNNTDVSIKVNDLPVVAGGFLAFKPREDGAKYHKPVNFNFPSAVSSGNVYILKDWDVNTFEPNSLNITGAGLATAANQTLQITQETAINTNIGATDEAAAGTDTATSGLNGLIKRYLQRFTSFLALLPASLGQKTMANSFAVTLASDQTGLTVYNNQQFVQVEMTRPADTTAYAVNDTVSNSTSAPTLLTFTSIGRAAGGSGLIVKARLMTDQAACVAQFRLHLFVNNTPTVPNDNSAFTLLYSNAALRIGSIDMPALNTEGSGSTAANSMRDDLTLAFNLTDTANIYVILETKTAFTPASGQKFFLELTARNN